MSRRKLEERRTCQFSSLRFMRLKLQEETIFSEPERLDRTRRYSDLALIVEDPSRCQQGCRQSSSGLSFDAYIPLPCGYDPVLLVLPPLSFIVFVSVQSQDPEGDVPVFVPVLTTLVAVCPEDPFFFMIFFDSSVVFVLVMHED